MYLASVDSDLLVHIVRTPISAVILGSLPGWGDNTVNFLRLVSTSDLLELVDQKQRTHAQNQVD